MLVAVETDSGFSRERAGKRISHLLFATRSNHGLPYIFWTF